MDEKTVKVYTDTLEFMPYGRAVALGFFDGMHRGHLDIIRKTVKFAKKNGLRSTVMTFMNFPKDNGICITTLNERLDILSAEGVDEMLVMDFEKVKDISPEEFFDDILRRKLNSVLLLSGDDYSFGKDARGDTALLGELCGKQDIVLKVIPAKCMGEDKRRISSTWMKECLRSGDAGTFTELSGGRPFFYEGIVSRGKGLGRQLGFPTANLNIPADKIVVARGVYVSRVTLGKTTFYGVTNVGLRPTVEDVEEPLAETFIFDFDDDIYGAFIRVELLKFLRPEVAFPSKEDLMAEVERNKEQAKTYLTESGMIS